MLLRTHVASVLLQKKIFWLMFLMFSTVFVEVSEVKKQHFFGRTFSTEEYISHTGLEQHKVKKWKKILFPKISLNDLKQRSASRNQLSFKCTQGLFYILNKFSSLKLLTHSLFHDEYIYNISRNMPSCKFTWKLMPTSYILPFSFNFPDCFRKIAYSFSIKLYSLKKMFSLKIA